MILSPILAARIQAVDAVGDTPVFTSTGGGLLNVSNFRSRHFTPAVKAAGLGHVRIHDLRHPLNRLHRYPDPTTAPNNLP